MKNTIIKLECIDITVDFYGVCKHEGLVIFVKGMIPGEIANVKIIKLKHNIAYGIIDELIKKSEYRIKEPCPVAYKCGSCDIQYIDYKYQLALKKSIIENTISNNKMNYIVLDPVPSLDIIAYRNKIQVPVSNNKIGYYRNHSNDIVEFDNCYIVDDSYNNILKDLKSYINEYSLSDIVRHIVIRSGSDGLMVCFVTKDITLPVFNKISNFITSKYTNIKSFMLNLNNKDTNVIFGDLDKCIFGSEYIIDKCNEISYMIPLRSFYQINKNQMINIYDYVVHKTCLSMNDNVLDLFCGIGTISLYISKFVKKVLGIEIVDKSIEYANKNKLLNNITNVDFIKADANDIKKYIDGYNAVILDPPRKGIDQNLVSTIIDSSINKIVYISCNQATLIRDLKLLEGHFKANEIQPFDMFPQTKHIECVVSLIRAKE